MNRFLFFMLFSLSFVGMSQTAKAAVPVPSISQPLSPDSALPGSPGFTLTVRGTGFISASVVRWNGRARSTTFVGTNQLTATILASDVAHEEPPA